MCGRFLMNEEALDAAGEIAEISPWVQGELKLGVIFPSNPSLVLVKNEDGLPSLQGAAMAFGYFSESMNKRLINARAETAASKWMFRRALKSSRCAVVCHAFYEWDKDKQKVTFVDGKPAMYLAAIAMEDQFVILTTEANASVSPWHHRMPVVLRQDEVYPWVLDDARTETILKQTPPMLEHLPLPVMEPLF